MLFIKGYSLKDLIILLLCSRRPKAFTKAELVEEVEKKIELRKKEVDKLNDLLEKISGDGHIESSEDSGYKKYTAKKEGCDFLNELGGYTVQGKKRRKGRE